MKEDNTSHMPEAASPSKKRGRPLLNAEDRRTEILDRAIELIAEGGLPSLSLRKLAAAAGTTTMSIYTLFGSKEGLAKALYEEGYRRLAEYQKSVRRDPHPIRWVGNLGEAYRTFALENPAYYTSIISATMPLSESASDGTPIARGIPMEDAYRELTKAVEQCQAEGFMKLEFTVRQIADALWATVHGLCSLELAGYCENKKQADERFSIGSAAVLNGFLSTKGREAVLSLDG